MTLVFSLEPGKLTPFVTILGNLQGENDRRSRINNKVKQNHKELKTRYKTQYLSKFNPRTDVLVKKKQFLFVYFLPNPNFAIVLN